MGSPRSSFSQGVGTSRQSPAPEVPEVAEWHTLLDVDFAALPNQTLSPDGPYLIGGRTWTKSNSASDLVSAQIVNGQGLVFCPISGLTAYQAGHTAPQISLPLSDLGSDPSVLAAETPLRAWIRATNANYGTLSFNESGIGLEYSGDSLVCATRLFNGTNPRGGECFLRHATALETIMTTYEVAESADCSCIWLPWGVGGMSTRFGRAQWSSGWPEMPFLVGWGPDRDRWNNSDWLGVGFSRNWSVALFAQGQTQGATYQWIIQNARVDAYY